MLTGHASKYHVAQAKLKLTNEYTLHIISSEFLGSDLGLSHTVGPLEPKKDKQYGITVLLETCVMCACLFYKNDRDVAVAVVCRDGVTLQQERVRGVMLRRIGPVCLSAPDGLLSTQVKDQ